MKFSTSFPSMMRWMMIPAGILFATLLSAQMRTITGRISSSDGEGLIGATVQVQSTTVRGAVTDANGGYSIQAATGETLVFAYLGLTSKTLKLGNETVVNMELEPDATLLEETVVVGYGTAKKSDLTGAVGSVTGEQIKSSVFTNFDQALQGRIAGVQVTQNSGAPGGAASIRIRGANSITGSSEPLYVIDGIPFQGDGSGVSGFDWAGGANGQNRVNP
ncbi:MAG TPA: carboxypeptidase-like regulatory domain-containing protein, partial [Haliscomenobacter sp.]|uniref:carboxypeptidase-like regulatory domain-containing protein n=1 Tax=Haliscomenobacter sp. TaxID=2717303 RepID=UPI002BB4A593